MTTVTERETRVFQTEVRQLLKLMIHSLYSNREIFLRELISNGSDACDKRRFRALAEPSLLPDESSLRIDIDFDGNAGTITVTDGGFGMSRDEATEHLGTIAKSGTAEFLAGLSGDAQKDAQLIGQFGVGFYSAFIVADRVEVHSRRADLPSTAGVRWESAGEGEFTVEDEEVGEVGTRVVLHLKPDAKEFADAWRLRALVRRYSDHIAFPVRMRKEGASGEFETVNAATALWRRAKSEVTEDEYVAFYKHVSHDSSAPLAWTHHRVEGKREYTTLLYLPAHAPFDLWQRDAARGLKLYVKRVFILDDAEQFLPLYLRFVKGIVDSNDLPLNVSRELLQQDPEIDAMRAGISRHALDLLGRLAEHEPEKYSAFWREFGQVLKEGVGEDAGNRERIAKLLRFASSNSDQEAQTESLDAYVARMRPGQKHIYYVLAETWNAARQSPHLERLHQHGVEVLLLHERVDEWMMGYLAEFAGHRLRDAARGELDLGELAPPAAEPESAASLALCGRLREVLSGRVDSVRVSSRLAESAACLVRGEQDMGVQMRKLMQAAGQKVPDARPSLEINPEHPLIARLAALPDGDDFKDLARLVLDEATLAEGSALPEPAEFVRRLNRLLLKA
jgi:molecular chaperone HtpG